MEKTEDILSLLAKIEELKKEFKKDFNYNKFENNLSKEMDHFLSSIIQSEIESLMHDKTFLSTLYVLAGKKCLKFEGFRMVCTTILNGHNILVSTPYFYRRGKTDKSKQGRGTGNNIDCHLGLSLIGMVSRFSGNLASEVCKMALLCPSNEMAIRLLNDRGIGINNKTLRKVVRDVGQTGLSRRGGISIGNKEDLEGKTLIIGTDGGRIRERYEKKWENKKGAKRKGYNTDWKEPVLFTMYLTDEKGEIDKGSVPLYDASMQGKDYIFTLMGKYLASLDCKKLSKIVFVGDGAPWIWARAEKLFREYFQETPTYQILDYTHAKQALNEILDLLPKKCQEREKISVLFKQKLWEGDIDGIEKMIRINFIGNSRKKALTKWGNYFQKNKERMQYSEFKTLGLPQGSGTVESAIRRVINLRLKSCGSFWKKENAEIYLFLRSQLISGRWNIFFQNLIKRIEIDEYQLDIKSNSYMKWAA
jgi:hypothetical protein